MIVEKSNRSYPRIRLSTSNRRVQAQFGCGCKMWGRDIYESVISVNRGFGEEDRDEYLANVQHETVESASRSTARKA